MCNCYTFEHPGKDLWCKKHNQVRRWIRSTCYGSDYEYTDIRVIGEAEVNRDKVRVQTKDGKLHTIGKDKLR